MTNPKLDDLIARVAAATGPSYALEELIFMEFHNLSSVYTASGARLMPPNYTYSLDTAMTLIQDDLWWVLAKGRTRPDEPLYGVQLLKSDDVVAETEHENFALAIVLAALKLRNA
jgi:hypothetical protein